MPWGASGVVAVVPRIEKPPGKMWCRRWCNWDFCSLCSAQPAVHPCWGGEMGKREKTPASLGEMSSNHQDIWQDSRCSSLSLVLPVPTAVVPRTLTPDSARSSPPALFPCLGEGSRPHSKHHTELPWPAPRSRRCHLSNSVAV